MTWPKANGARLNRRAAELATTHTQWRVGTRAHCCTPPRKSLGTEASAERRDRLTAEINGLSSSDEAAVWAHRCLAEKSKLHEVDAQQVEDSFAAKLATFAGPLCRGLQSI